MHPRHPHARPGLLLLALFVGACTGELTGGQEPALDQRVVSRQDQRVIDAPRPLHDTTTSLPPDKGAPSSRLTVRQIVGGPYTVIQPYGPQQISYDYSYCQAYGAPVGTHCGLDIALTRGSPLFAAGAGTVLQAGGTGVFSDDLVYSAGELHFKLADGTEVMYGHCSKVEVAVDQTITVNQRVALSGTGNASPHLHLEVRVPDPSLPSKLRTVDPITLFGP